MHVRLIATTQPAALYAAQGGPETAEELMVYCARVSSPDNQNNHETGERLLRYCLRKGHWSVFEQASMTLEITTSRAIAAQILRHRSFTFQEFSQRYAHALTTEIYEARRQGQTNRQSSTDDLPTVTKEWFEAAQDQIHETAFGLYEDAIGRGIAKECARFLLPLSTSTRLYMNGTVRSWLHWFERRRAPDAQHEHREIAEAAWVIFKQQFPVTAGAMEEEQ